MNALGFGIEQSISSWYGMLIMVGMACMSIYLVALIIRRAMFFRKMNVDSKSILNDAQKAITTNDARILSDLGTQRATDPPVKILLGSALANQHLSEPELAELFGIVRVRQKERLTKGLSSFGTMATIAPFIGLLGTVMGIIESFHSLAESGAAGPNVVSSGVAAALWATAAGLCVAIPSVVAYNVFNHKAKQIMTELEVVGREILILLRNKGRTKMKMVKEA